MRQNDVKMQNSTLPKFEISVCEKMGFGKMRNRDTKTRILTFTEFRFAKNKKIGAQKLEIRFRFKFEFRGRKFVFQNSKIVFSHFSRISIRDHQI